MSQEDCQQIENFLKSLIFKSSSDLSSSYDIVSSKEPSLILTNAPIESSFHERELGGQPDLCISSSSQSSNSALIDRVALTRFAAGNLESYPGSSNAFQFPSTEPRNYTLFNDNQMVDRISHPYENVFSPSLFPLDIASNSIENNIDAVKNVEYDQRRFSSELEIKENGIESSTVPLPIGSEIAQNLKEILHHLDVAPQANTKRNSDLSQKTKRKKRSRPARTSKPFNDDVPKPRFDPIPDETIDMETAKKEVLIPKPPKLGLTPKYAFRKGKQGKLVFNCDACDTCLSGEAITKHLESPTHNKKIQLLESDKYLHKLPAPLDAQVSALTLFLQNLADVYGLNPSQAAQRQETAQRINSLVLKNLPECSVEAAGSSVSGFGLKRSELDLLLRVPDKANAADMLAATSEILVKEKGSSAVKNEFKEKIPRIQFREKSHLLCNLSIESGNAVQMSKLLLLYSCLDERAELLGKVFRFWADSCQLTKPDKGTLPPIAFSVMLIHFLQQQQPPVLPVLHELPEFNDGADIDNFRMKWKSKNKSPIGLLWLQLFYFYCFRYKAGVDVVSIRSLARATCSQKNWNTKCIAIEDPCTNRNLAHVIANQNVFQFIMDCFLNTYRYFGYPRLKTGPIKFVKDTTEPSSSNATSACDTPTRSIISGGTSTSADLDSESDETLDNILEDHDADIPFEDVIAAMSKMSLPDMDEKTVSSDIENAETSQAPVSVNEEIESEKKIDITECKDLLGSIHLDENANFRWDTDSGVITKEMIKYDFQTTVFRGDKKLPLVCRLCAKTGHLKNDCPAEQLPPILSLPPMTKQFMSAITDICYDIIRENRPSIQYCQEREKDMTYLQSVIRQIYPNAMLRLFGSFRNGFCFIKSDMDFCLTFEGEDGKDLDHTVVIEKLAERFHQCSSLKNITPILSAKVPILKFFDMRSQLEGDISLYNTLAQYNTRMIEAYCNIDERVQIIGYVFKYFAKILGICDASKGSLSSYAYILMAVFFLQQRQPPVIPVLQELHDGEMPEDKVDGWNAWFFSDLPNIKNVWKGYKKNTESVGELWLALLNFYVSEFNMKDYVISIRQKKPLSRFSKLWNSKKIAIEDPFDLNHNLGSGLSRKMNNFILKALIRGREHFGTPVSLPHMYQSNSNGLKGYFFDRYCLNDGNEPPKDRGCRYCGKIGHKLAECPNKNSFAKRDDRRNRKVEPNPGIEKKKQQQHQQHLKQQQHLQQQQLHQQQQLQQQLHQQQHYKRQYETPSKAKPRHNPSPNKSITPNQPVPERMQQNFLAHGMPPPPPKLSISPQAFKNAYPPQVFPNGPLMMPPSQQCPRPATSFPFPVNGRPANSGYANQNAQNPVPGTQWTPAPSQRDNFVETDIPWQHVHQASLPNRMQNHLPQRLQQHGFLPPPGYHPQMVPERLRTNSDGSRYQQPF